MKDIIDLFENRLLIYVHVHIEHIECTLCPSSFPAR